MIYDGLKCYLWLLFEYQIANLYIIREVHIKRKKRMKFENVTILNNKSKGLPRRPWKVRKKERNVESQFIIKLLIYCLGVNFPLLLELNSVQQFQ